MIDMCGIISVCHSNRHFVLFCFRLGHNASVMPSKVGYVHLDLLSLGYTGVKTAMCGRFKDF